MPKNVFSKNNRIKDYDNFVLLLFLEGGRQKNTLLSGFICNYYKCLTIRFVSGLAFRNLVSIISVFQLSWVWL